MTLFTQAAQHLTQTAHTWKWNYIACDAILSFHSKLKNFTWNTNTTDFSGLRSQLNLDEHSEFVCEYMRICAKSCVIFPVDTIFSGFFFVLVVRGIFDFLSECAPVDIYRCRHHRTRNLHTAHIDPNENRNVGSFAYICQSLFLSLSFSKCVCMDWTLWFPNGDKCFLTLLLIPNQCRRRREREKKK